ncbi:MAG: 2-amino-4-hydroxy-6-hydroxymethyldihydropteridine diphosphokinase [Anaerolineales bacterium]|nr:2-amino-4-hydroxy-6-hydroxymethyldihydropteridine diphosphokinase [Anaerolineales bacterium]
MDHIVYLAFGSNMGDRLANLKMAVGNLAPQMSLKAKSQVYETPPWGYKNQPAFLNQVIKAETYLDAPALLKHLKRLEKALGREPGFENGPRLIDIDILFFDDEIVDTPALTIPHPRLHERAFVLVPLADIAPNFVHPILNKTVFELLADVDQSGIAIFE